MEVLDVANDFTGPLIDDTFPDPEGLKPVRKPRRLAWLTAALFLICGGLVLISVASWRLVMGESEFIEGLSFTPFSDPSKLPRDFRLWTGKDFAREFAAFQHRFGGHGSQRFGTFVDNLRFIDAHNRQPGARVWLQPNQFTDLRVDEWARLYLAETRTEEEVLSERDARRTLWNLAAVSNSSLPESVNWIDRGCVTPIKDQSHCGSCWAFSSTGAIEGALCAQTGKLLSLSEQQLMDCSGEEGTHGCQGGFMDNAFRYVLRDGGLCSESDYPYRAKQGDCNHGCRRVAKIEDIYDVPPRNVKAMKAAIVLHGPVAAAVEADKTVFQFYHRGILDLDCGRKLNHAILVVGYGAQLNPATNQNETYWLVKNSWGTAWGDQGYIRLGIKHHGKAGECGILLAPTVPVVTENDLVS